MTKEKEENNKIDKNFIIENKNKIIIIFLVIVLAGGYIIYGKYKEANPDFTYKVVSLEERNLQKEISIDGRIVSDYEIDLASEIPGIISKIYVKEGDYVKKGQLLMKLKDTDLRSQVSSSYANQKINIASLEKVKNPNQNIDLDKKTIEDSREIILSNVEKTKFDIQADIDSLEIYLSQILRMDIDDYFEHTEFDDYDYSSNPVFTYRIEDEIETKRLEKSRKDLGLSFLKYTDSEKNLKNSVEIIEEFNKMIFDLYKNTQYFKSFSDYELELKEKAITTLKNEVMSKKNNLVALETQLSQLENQLDSNYKAVEKVDNSVADEDVKIAQEKINLAKVQTNNAYLQLQKTNIRATRSGVVSEILKEEGEYAGPSSPLVKVISKDKYIKALIPEVDIAKINLDMDVNIKIDAYSDKVFKGKIGLIYPAEKESQGITYYEIKITLNEEEIKEFNILPGMSLEVFIIYDQKDNVLSVKRGVAKKDEKGYFVQILNSDKSKPIDEKFVNKYFEYGFIGDKYVEVISGFDEKDKIINVTDSLKKKK